MIKIVAPFMLAAVMVVVGMPSSADAGHRCRCFGRRSSHVVVTSTVETGRRYSYEPGVTTSSRSARPSYLMQKTDHGKYRVN